MFTLAFKMLAGDPTKVLGIIIGMTLSTALIAQQGSLFYGLMLRSQSVISAADEVDVWVMHPATRQFNSATPLADADVMRVRGVAGVAWTAPMIKANVSVSHRLDRARARLRHGHRNGQCRGRRRPFNTEARRQKQVQDHRHANNKNQRPRRSTFAARHHRQQIDIAQSGPNDLSQQQDPQ